MGKNIPFTGFLMQYVKRKMNFKSNVPSPIPQNIISNPLIS